jgi:WD40 repeat protein
MIELSDSRLPFCRTLVGRSFVHETGTFGSKPGRQQVFLCSKFLDSHIIVTGTQEGSIYVWNAGGVLVHIVPKAQAHSQEIFDICVRPAVMTSQADDDDGDVAPQALVYHVLTGGADGKAILWKFEKTGKEKVVVSKLYQVAPSNCCIRSVFIMQAHFAIGTAHNKLYLFSIDTASNTLQVEGDKREVLAGHAEGQHKEGRVNCVCCSPDQYLFATGGSDDTVVLWDMRLDQNGRKAIKRLSLVSTPMAMDWSDADGWVAVILKSGSIDVLQVHGNNDLKNVNVITGKGCGAAVRFSPDANFLAVGRRNGRLDLFKSTGPGAFELIKSFSAHPGPCCALDWASMRSGDDFCYLRSNSYEPEDLIFWKVATSAEEAKQVRRMKEISHCIWHKELCRVSWLSQGLIQGQGVGPASEFRSEFRPSAHVPCLASPPSVEQRHMACGCVDGVVLLFSRPCLSIRSLGRPYFGHSAPVRGLAYSCNNDGLITCGDKLVILQWEVSIPKGSYMHAADGNEEHRVQEHKDSALQKIFGTLHTKVKAHNFADALDCLDDAFEHINESLVGEFWKKKFLDESERLVRAAMIRGTHLKATVASHLEQGIIDRRGWPVERMLDEMRSMLRLFDSFVKLFPQLQNSMPGIQDFHPEVDKLQEEMQKVLGQVIRI